MVRILQVISSLALMATVVVFTCLFLLQPQHAFESELCFKASIAEQFTQLHSNNPEDRQLPVHPLVKEAEEFARYLKPQELKKASETKVSYRPSQATVRVILPEVSPKFVLVATSYYRSNPEESMALITEPGTGFRWVKEGTHLGRFVIDKIEPGRIIYRNVDSPGHVVLNMEKPARASANHQITSESSQTGHSVEPSIVPRERETEAHELDQQSDEAQPITENVVVKGIGS